MSRDVIICRCGHWLKVYLYLRYHCIMIMLVVFSSHLKGTQSSHPLVTVLRLGIFAIIPYSLKFSWNEFFVVCSYGAIRGLIFVVDSLHSL